MIDAGHPFVPVGGETENGFRKLCSEHSKDGLKCTSAGSGPAQVAVAIKTALAALDGEVVPQSIALPLSIVSDPDFKDGESFYSKETDNFFVGNSFPTCGINFTAQEIMGQSQANQ
jgi:ribose transport system substrate-binding protein